MTATVNESIPECAVKVSPKSRVGRGIFHHSVESKVGFWSSLSKVAMRIFTQLNKSAEYGDCLAYARESERVNGSRQPILWFGRMILWPDRSWSTSSELNTFALEREIKRSRDESAYRKISPK